MTNSFQARQKVRFGEPRSFPAVLRASLKEVLFPDDPFGEFKNEPFSRRVIKGFQYFVPILDWLPHYNLNLFMYDVLAGITIASLAIPQGISYAKLANIPPIIGLYSSFVPPLIYAVFGSSKHLAVGTVAASSLLIAATIEEVVKPQDNLELYVDLVFTATLVSGLMQTVMGLLRLGILVDFLSHSTITGFMGGTAVLICLQQLKGILGLKHFTHKTDLISVIRSIFANKNECNWRAIVIGVVFLAFLQSTRYVKKKIPRLFWVSAIAPMVCVIVGCLFAYFAHADKLGIQTVGDLKKGINPLSIQRLNFDPKYIYAPIKAGTITAMIALAEGIAIGRSFAVMQNEQIDGNKEMIAFGLMNIIGSFTSCYLTTGPFSKTAVNYNAGCRTAMSNVVMSICMCLTLLFLAPIFSYTPLVALSAIIASAMLGLIKYKKFYHLYQTDKFDFLICMVGVFGVIFISMTYGLVLSISLALVRALLHVARPPSCKLGSMVESGIYCDIEQYPGATGFPGILILQLGSPIYFANANYIRERILRWIRDEQKISNSKGAEVEFLLLDFGAINSIDVTGIETLVEIRKSLLAKEIKMILINPRLGVMEKLMLSKFIEIIGKESVFLSIDDAIEFCKFSLKSMSSV
ncbi:PREDICTED: probable sulfate transporter 3.5 isoform X1 [Ipomoea nil]|uniref:probable sulfate transporter 3.5 isoform X1 n=1 Tax=Ipomoea nil TaxID=35883 RepID=UPI000901670B|nr:PREDICTED: probable sulfate transporter 3.5 isoform X1 [Ipomoea nil]